MSSPFAVPPGFDEASNEQRIAFVQELWDRIAANPQRVPVPPEHRRILEERLAAYATDPQPGRPWNEVRDELLGRLRRT
jgi:putative addiction module component (TIGR02574 family)